MSATKKELVPVAKLREHSQAASGGIKAWAGEATQTIGWHLQMLKDNLPQALADMPATERRQIIDELRDALIEWTERLDPVARDLRAVLRDCVTVSWERNVIERHEGEPRK